MGRKGKQVSKSYHVLGSTKRRETTAGHVLSLFVSTYHCKQPCHHNRNPSYKSLSMYWYVPTMSNCHRFSFHYWPRPISNIHHEYEYQWQDQFLRARRVSPSSLPLMIVLMGYVDSRGSSPEQWCTWMVDGRKTKKELDSLLASQMQNKNLCNKYQDCRPWCNSISLRRHTSESVEYCKLVELIDVNAPTWVFCNRPSVSCTPYPVIRMVFPDVLLGAFPSLYHPQVASPPVVLHLALWATPGNNPVLVLGCNRPMAQSFPTPPFKYL